MNIKIMSTVYCAWAFRRGKLSVSVVHRDFVPMASNNGWDDSHA